MSVNLLESLDQRLQTPIEWDALTHSIQSYFYFEENKKRATQTVYFNRVAELTADQAKTQLYLSQFSDEDRLWIIQLFKQVAPDESLMAKIQFIEKAGVLNLRELNDLARLIEILILVKTDLKINTLPELTHIKIQDFGSFQRRFLKEFRYLVEPDGTFIYDRHPEISELKKRISELEEKLRKTIQEWLTHTDHQKLLQFNSYDVIYDRYVVPVRSDSYRSDLGIIVSRSDSGQTLYVEPYSVRELCNRRMELLNKFDELINTLCLRFSTQLAHVAGDLKFLYHQLVDAELYISKGELAQSWGLSAPITRETPGFDIRKLFHPLIKSPVKNDVTCDSKSHGIVISGPNTGGKTVFLKSITLCYLFYYHGHFVPAVHAELYPYDGLFYFGNDLQNLSSGLSSFSGEVKNYISLIEHLRETNLVLIDEIFNSTSSDEASALSLAYFNELHRRGKCHIVVSTHHQMFKTLVHQDQQYISAHVGFDPELLRPTYKMIWGTPGPSMALDIFKLLSSNHPSVSHVPEEALKYINSKNVSYETLLQKVSQKQVELDNLLTEQRQLNVDLRNQKGSMEGILKLRLQDEITKARNEVQKIVQEAYQFVDEAKAGNIHRKKRVDDMKVTLQQKVRELDPDDEITPEIIDQIHVQFEELKVGDIVFSLKLRKDFTVLSLDQRKKEVTIGKGPMKFSVPFNTLSKTKGHQLPAQNQVRVSFQKSSNITFEYDVRGMRLSDCQNLVEKSLGDLLSGDVPFLNIIHGHGDGILKKWLRDYLKRSKDFEWAVPENGNDGETKITLK